MIRAAWVMVLAISVGLGLVLRAELLTPSRHEMAVAPVQLPAPAAMSSTDGRAALAEQALARPLFSPNRRPAAALVRDTRVGDGPPRLTAIVLAPGGGQAIFAPSGGGRSIALSVGDRLGAEIVRTIALDAVTLDGPSGRRVLHTEFDQRTPKESDTNPLALPGMITGVLPQAVPTGQQPPKVP